MPRYLIVYLGGSPPATPEQGRKHFARYMDWLAVLGGAVVSPANPLKDTTTINPDGSMRAGGATSMSGYTIVQADSLDAALSLARDCPFLQIGGSLEVSELVTMPAPT